MIELVFIACLQTTPNVCKEQNLVFTDAISPTTCMMRAQPQLAKWAESHIRWRIARWKCRSASQRLEPI
jgi:hypothetical protein